MIIAAEIIRSRITCKKVPLWKSIEFGIIEFEVECDSL